MESTKEEAMQLFGTFLDLVELHRCRIHSMIMESEWKVSDGIADEVHTAAKEAGTYLVKALPTDAMAVPVMEIITGALARSYKAAMMLVNGEENDT